MIKEKWLEQGFIDEAIPEGVDVIKSNNKRRRQKQPQQENKD